MRRLLGLAMVVATAACTPHGEPHPAVPPTPPSARAADTTSCPPAPSGPAAARVTPRIVLQDAHAGTVENVAFSPTGRYLATVGSDQTTRMWQASDFALLRTVRAPTGAGLAWLDDDSVAVGDEQGTRAYGVDPALAPEARGVTLQEPSLDARAGSVSLTVKEQYKWGERQLLVTADGATHALPLPERPFGVNAVAVALSDDGRSAALLTTAELFVFDVARRALRWKAEGGSCVAFSHDGRRLATGDVDGAVRVRDVATGRLEGELGRAALRPALDAEFLDDDRIVVAHRERAVDGQRWTGDVATWSLRDARRESDGTWSPDKNDMDVTDVRLAPVGDGDLAVVPVRAGDCTPQREGEIGREAVWLQVWPRGAAPGASGPRTCTATQWLAGSAGGYVGSELLGLHVASQTLLYSSPVEGLGVAHLRARTHAPLAGATSEKQPHSGALSPDGTLVAGVDDAGALTSWSTDDGRVVARDASASLAVGAPTAFARDGETVAVADGAGVALFDRALRATARVPLPARVAALACGRDVVLAATADGGLHALRGGRLEASGRADDVAIARLRLSPDERTALSIDVAGTVRVWDAARAMPRGVLADYTDDEWLAATPSGLYTGTPEVGDRVGWAFSAPAERFSVERFRALRDPARVARVLVGTDQDQAPRVLRPPRVSFAGAPPDHTTAAEVSVRVQAASGDRVDRVRAFVEGRAVAERAVCAARAEADLAVPLLPGENHVSVVAFDREGGASNQATFEIERRGGPRPRAWVVSVGIDHYPGLPENAQLHAAAADARSVAERFAAMKGGAYGDVHTRVLTDGDATVPRIRAALDELATMSPADVAIVFFAGHGYLPRPEADMLFLTGAVRAGVPPAADVDALGWGSVGAALGRAAGRVIVLLDACHSGHFTQEVSVPNDALAASLARARSGGILVFAASKGRQPSYEPSTARGFALDARTRAAVLADAPVAHGFFTGALLAALDDPSTDRDGDGALQASELVDEVTRRVVRATEARQTPWVALRRLFGDFTVTERAARPE